MLPTFAEFDILLAKEIAPEELRVNDIGIYQHPEKKNFINHRVIMKTEEGYYFKGDGTLKQKYLLFGQTAILYLQWVVLHWKSSNSI